MTTTRYTLVTCILLALALIPVFIHEYSDYVYDDGRRTTLIPAILDGAHSAATNRYPQWGKEIFNTDDWVERTYDVPGHGRILLFVARSHDPKRLYHHPELAILYGIDMKAAGIITLDDASVIHAHLLQATHGNGKAAFTLLYEDGFITNPIRFQLETSLGLLFKPRKQMTLFFVYDENIAPDTPFSATIAAEIMKNAIRAFLHPTHD